MQRIIMTAFSVWVQVLLIMLAKSTRIVLRISRSMKYFVKVISTQFEVAISIKFKGVILWKI